MRELPAEELLLKNFSWRTPRALGLGQCDNFNVLGVTLAPVASAFVSFLQLGCSFDECNSVALRARCEETDRERVLRNTKFVSLNKA